MEQRLNAARAIRISYVFTDTAGSWSYDVTLHSATPRQIGAMAITAGLTPQGRWHAWGGCPLWPLTTPVSVYRK